MHQNDQLVIFKSKSVLTQNSVTIEKKQVQQAIKLNRLTGLVEL